MLSFLITIYSFVQVSISEKRSLCNLPSSSLCPFVLAQPRFVQNVKGKIARFNCSNTAVQLLHLLWYYIRVHYYLLRNATKRSRSHLTSRGSIISQGSLLSFPTFLCHNATKLEDQYNITTLHYLPHYIQ